LASYLQQANYAALFPKRLNQFFIKGLAATPIEDLVAQAQCAAALDTLDKLKTIPQIDNIIVATPSIEFGERLRPLGFHIETSTDDDFHWGNSLIEIMTKRRIEVPFYIGGGSGVLMTTDDWRTIADYVSHEDNIVVTNNFFSADFAAWTPGEAVLRFEPPRVDNDLAYRLGERAHLRVIPLPKNAATQLDIDTPTDLLTLALHPGVGKHLRAFLDTAHLDITRVNQVRTLLRERRATILLAGRVSASLALFLEQNTMCQWRILSEERGMRASGRDERGEVRSLFGLHLDQIGARALVSELAQLADAALIDSRVLFAHRRLRPTAPDRFYSDLLEPAAIRESPIPIVLGGHSLVSGGLYALAETQPNSP
jgi:hypothetical protein